MVLIVKQTTFLHLTLLKNNVEKIVSREILTKSLGQKKSRSSNDQYFDLR